MSATAFQRLRREAAVLAAKPEEIKEPDDELTKKQIMALLDEKGIKYDNRANKAVLTERLTNAQNNIEDEVPETEPDNSEGAE